MGKGIAATNGVMRRRKRRQHGVFCLEGDWWSIRDKTTIEPALVLLQTNGNLAFDYIHRDVGTVEELHHYLRKWVQRDLRKYPILYLGFHGAPGMIWVGDNRRREAQYRLDALADRLEGACQGKLIHFGSCGTLRVHGQALNRFLRRTGALAVCGYEDDVGWLDTAAFEILLLSELQGVSFTRTGMAAVKRRVATLAGGLSRKLQFRMVIS